MRCARFWPPNQHEYDQQIDQEPDREDRVELAHKLNFIAGFRLSQSCAASFPNCAASFPNCAIEGIQDCADPVRDSHDAGRCRAQLCWSRLATLECPKCELAYKALAEGPMKPSTKRAGAKAN